MPSNVKVSIKNHEKTLKHVDLSYELDNLYENPYIKKLVDDTIKEFNAEVEKTRVTITLDFD